MKREQTVILIGVLVVLCLCVVIGGIVAYLLLGRQQAVTSPQATETPSPLEATPVPLDTAEPQPTPLPATPTLAPDAPLSTAAAYNVVSGARMPATHRIAFDGAGVLHLVWGDIATGFFHQSMESDGMWRQAELLTGDFQTIFGLVDLIPDPAGQVCAFFNAATDSNVPSTLGLYKRCLVEGRWSTIEGPYVRGDWQHSPAFAPDGAMHVAQLSGPGRAPVQFADANLSPGEGFVYHLQLAIDAGANYHVLWERRVGDAYHVEYRFSANGGQTWTEIQTLADLPTQLTLLSAVADVHGAIHVAAWAGAEGVFYKRWIPPGHWEPVQEVTGEQEGGSWGDLAVGPDGLAHIVWGNEFAEVKHYVRQRADGLWSRPRLITTHPVTEVRLAVDPFGSRHFVWRGSDHGLYYIALPPVTLGELGGIEGRVVVTTDKAEYERGEPVQISLTNNLDVPIWYAGSLDCGLSFWQLEGGEPRRGISHAVPCVWAEPDHDFTPLNPGETVTSEWNGVLEVRGDSGIVEQWPEPGRYRIRVPLSLSVPRHEWGPDKMEVVSDDFAIK